MLLNNGQREFEAEEVAPRHRFELRFTAHGDDVVSVGMCARDPHQEVVARPPDGALFRGSLSRRRPEAKLVKVSTVSRPSDPD